MKRMIIVLCIMLFGLGLTISGAVFLGGCSVVVEDGNSKEPYVPKEDEEEDSNQEDDESFEGQSNFNFTVTMVERTSYNTTYTGASCYAPGTSQAPEFDVHWCDENGNSQTWGNTPTCTAAFGWTVSYGSSGDNRAYNLSYFKYSYTSGWPRRHARVIMYSMGNMTGYTYCGMTSSIENNYATSSSSSQTYYLYQTTYSTSQPSNSSCTDTVSGNYYFVFRKNYTNTFNSNGGSSVSNQTIMAGISFNLPGASYKTGYTFDGWYNNGTLYGSTSRFTESLANTGRDFTAQWVPNTYSVYLDPNGGTLSSFSQLKVTNLSGYNFTQGSDGYYTSGNAGISNSYSLCRVSFYCSAGTNLVFSVYNYAEVGWDFGIFGNLNTSLSASYDEDTSGVYRSFKQLSMSTEQFVEYNITSSGSFYIDIKFRKDSSNNYYNDSLRFKIQDNTITSNVNANAGGYGFSLNSSGFYESQNFGVNYSYSMAAVGFYAQSGSNITFAVINYAETNYDFGIFSNLDTSLVYSDSEDTSNVYKSFKGESDANVKYVQYSIPWSGYHYIYIKYRKDQSTSNYNDSLQFKLLGTEVKFGNSYGALPTPYRTNYDFVGWYTMDGTRIYSSSVVSIADGHTLQARWEPKTFYLTVNYTSQNATNTSNISISSSSCNISVGSISFGNTSSVSHTYSSSTYSVTISRSNSSYDYYMSYNGVPTTSSYNGVNSFTYYWQPLSDITINVYVYQRYSINFNVNGGSGTVPSTVYKIHGTSATIPTNTLTRSSYTANGWNTNSSGTGTSYTTSYGISTGSITLYANWTPQYSTVKVQLMTSEDGVNYSPSYAGGSVNVSYYTSANNNPLSMNAVVANTASLNTISSAVLINYASLYFTATSNTGYVYVGTSTNSSTPTFAGGLPSNTFWPTTQNTTYNLYVYFNKLSTNKLKYDSSDQYFYFEDGEYPQSYVGEAMNTTLINGISGSAIPTYNLPYNDGIENINIPVYTYPTDNKRYARIEKNSQVKWFKVEPIRWRVSDYGVSSTQYPSDNTNIVTFATTGSAWEILGNQVSVTPNTTYTLKVNCKVPSFRPLSGYSGLGLMILNSAPTNTDCTSMMIERYQINNSNDGEIELKFNSGSNSIIYIVLNGGYLEDLQTYSFKFYDFSLTGGASTGFERDITKWTKYFGASSMTISKGEVSWSTYGSYNTNFTVVSDKVIGIGAVTNKNIHESWGFADSELYTNVSTKNQNLEFDYAQNNSEGIYDFYGKSGQNIKVEHINKNIFDSKYISDLSNFTVNEATYKSDAKTIGGTNNAFSYFKVQIWNKDGSYSSVVADSNLQRYTFTITKDSNTSYFRLGFNGNLADGVFNYDLTYLENGVYTFSVELISFSSSIAEFGNIKLEKGDKFTGFVYDTGLKVVSLDDLNYFDDKRAKPTDMVAFLLNVSATSYVDYWTRNLGNNLGNGKIITKAGIEKITYLTNLRGVRFSMSMREGSR